MLKKIVATVGYDIPIQELFDLVIGTSTGKPSDIEVKSSNLILSV